MIHWQCRDKIGPLCVDTFWQLHYGADDLTLLEDYSACILQHQTLSSEDINKLPYSANLLSVVHTKCLCCAD